MTNPTIVLKSIHNDIVSDNANSTLTTKQMRAKLRVEMADVHVRNASWIFTPAQADKVRAMFDPAFAEKLERRKSRKPRAKKAAAKSTASADA